MRKKILSQLVTVCHARQSLKSMIIVIIVSIIYKMETEEFNFKDQKISFYAQNGTRITPKLVYISLWTHFDFT